MLSPQSIIAVCPVNTTGLPNEPDNPLPVPSIAHSIITCDGCSQDCWIGPEQRNIRAVHPLRTWCYWCIARAGYMNNPMIGLNPSESQIPRRR